MIRRQKYGKAGVLTMSLTSIVMVLCVPMLLTMALRELALPLTAMWKTLAPLTAVDGSLTQYLGVYCLSLHSKDFENKIKNIVYC